VQHKIAGLGVSKAMERSISVPGSIRGILGLWDHFNGTNQPTRFSTPLMRRRSDHEP
jgi:hypothetical protein